MTLKTSSLERGASALQMLTALQATPQDASRGASFGRVLEGNLQPRPAESPSVRSQGAERQPELQKPRTENRPSRPEPDHAPSPTAQDQQARSAEPASDAEPAERSNQPNDAASGDKSDAPDASTAMPGEDQDPAKLAVLAAVIAALRGSGAPAEADGEAPPPAIRASQGKPGASLASDTEGKSDGKRPTTAHNGAAPTQLAANNTADTTKPVASLRTPEVANALSAATLPARNAAPQTGTNENPGNLPPTALITALRGESMPVQKMLVPTPAGQRLWADDVANRVIWMAGRGEGRAELVLTPPNLGKLGVSIQMNGEQTTAHFVAASAAAREALEQALPRLREALQQAGITLGDTSVSTSGDQQARNGGESSAGSDGRSQADEYGILPEAAEVASSSRWTQVGNNLVDTFA